MRWGLIARPELNRGLGVQTRSIAARLKPDKILMVHLPGYYGPAWEPDADLVMNVPFDGRFGHRDLAVDWMKDLDVVLSVETFYDDWFHRQLQANRVKTVLYGNPEFHSPHLFKPDAYWWPTSWLQAKVSRGLLMPMGVDNSPVHRPATRPDGPLRVLHPVGRPALGDRNGTQLLLEALQFVTVPIDLKITALESFPAVEAFRAGRYAIPSDAQVTVDSSGTIVSRWDVYQNQEILMLPRRYGGLCLPVLEAAASGLGIVMQECPPNGGYPALLMPSSQDKVLAMPVGQVLTRRCAPAYIGRVLNILAKDPERVALMQANAHDWARAHSWEVMGPRWLEEMEKLCN